MTADMEALVACENTDREIWRGPDEGNGSYYADSIHVTATGGIGINCGGHVIVKPLRDWHRLAATPKAGVEREVIARALEGVILRRAHEKRIEGYTLEMSLEQADAILSLSVGEQEIVQEEAHATKQSPSRAEDSTTETAACRDCGTDAPCDDRCPNHDEIPANDREIRTGAHLLLTAKSLGWPDDGEGALEFMLRRAREVAFEDCENRNEQSAQGLSRATGALNPQDDIAEQNYRDGLGPDGEK